MNYLIVPSYSLNSALNYNEGCKPLYTKIKKRGCRKCFVFDSYIVSKYTFRQPFYMQLCVAGICHKSGAWVQLPSFYIPKLGIIPRCITILISKFLSRITIFAYLSGAMLP